MMMADRQPTDNWHQKLIDLAERHDVGYPIKKWIRRLLSQEEAHKLYDAITSDRSLLERLASKIPKASTAKGFLVGTATTVTEYVHKNYMQQ